MYQDTLSTISLTGGAFDEGVFDNFKRDMHYDSSINFWLCENIYLVHWDSPLNSFFSSLIWTFHY